MARIKNSLASLLAKQGFGTYKECIQLIKTGKVEMGYPTGASVDWKTLTDPLIEVSVEGLSFKVGELILPYLKEMHVVLHKPMNFECSHSPSHHSSIFSLLPAPVVKRGVEAVGRLDADTTGMLLLSDSGRFNHYFTSPKKKIEKIYRVDTKHPISEEQRQKLQKGVQLHGEKAPTSPAKLIMLSPQKCELHITQGKYHQVKRMFAAVGNRVEKLHRLGINKLTLKTELLPGKWQILSEADLELLGYHEN